MKISRQDLNHWWSWIKEAADEERENAKGIAELADDETTARGAALEEIASTLKEALGEINGDFALVSADTGDEREKAVELLQEFTSDYDDIGCEHSGVVSESVWEKAKKFLEGLS